MMPQLYKEWEKKMKLYMYVTRDKYELPIAVAGSTAELGEMIGVSGRTISRTICMAKKQGSNSAYKKVVVKDLGSEEA